MHRGYPTCKGHTVMKHLREGTGPRPLALWGWGRALAVGRKPRCRPAPPSVCRGASCLAAVRPAFLTSRTGLGKKLSKSQAHSGKSIQENPQQCPHTVGPSSLFLLTTHFTRLHIPANTGEGLAQARAEGEGEQLTRQLLGWSTVIKGDRLPALTFVPNWLHRTHPET